jgi:membrane-associated phospholipid phosphatase
MTFAAMQLTGFRQRLGTAGPFIMAMVLIWVLALGWLLLQGREAAFLKIRPADDFATDPFFQYFTHVGDGLFAVAVVIVLLLMRQFGFAFVTFFGYAVSGLLAQLLKRLISEWRPAPYFQQRGISIHAVDGVDLLQSATSFPSGHTATGFALATALVLMSRWWQQRWMLALLLACGIGYSRVYLGQHFLQDVLAGSFLGVMASVAGVWVLEKWQPRFYRQQ